MQNHCLNNILSEQILIQMKNQHIWSLRFIFLSVSLLLLSFFNLPFVTILYSSSHCIAQLDLPHHRPKPLYVPVTRNNESTFCTRDQYLAPRVAFITWLVTFFLEKKYVSSAAAAQSAKNGTEVIPKLIQVSMTVPFCCFLIVSLWMEEVGFYEGIFAVKPLSTCVQVSLYRDNSLCF